MKLPSTDDTRCGTSAGHQAHRKRNETPCDPCRLAYNAQQSKWRKAHPGKEAATHAKYYKANRARLLARQRECYKANPEKMAEYQVGYRKANFEKIAIKNAAYRLANREKIAIQRVAYYKANREKIAEHHTEYYRVNREKLLAYQLKYREANPEEVLAAIRKWRLANPEKIVEARARYEKENPGKRTASRAAWSKKNPEKDAIQSRNRRARLCGVGSEPYTTQDILTLHGRDCHICSEPIDFNAPRQIGKHGWQRGLQLDHVIPISKGGNNTLGNVKPAHGICNTRKNSKILDMVGSGL